MTVLVTGTLADAHLPPHVLDGLAAQRQPAAGSQILQQGGMATEDADALAALRRMALKEGAQDAEQNSVPMEAAACLPPGQLQAHALHVRSGSDSWQVGAEPFGWCWMESTGQC